MGDINYFLSKSKSSASLGDAPVFRVRFADCTANVSQVNEREMSVAMGTPTHRVDVCENWWAESGGNIQYGSISNGDLRYVDVGENVIVFGKLGAIENVEATVNHAYNELFSYLLDSGFTTLLRSWNFIPRINEVPRGEIERYRSFCAGRARAFEAFHLSENLMPAATGIGSHSKDILGYIVASRSCQYRNIENPLQTPAYRYPRCYGPRAPSFARATVLKEPKQSDALRTCLFLSGTASIRGSETVGEGNLLEQIDIMMENVEYILSSVDESETGQSHGFTLEDMDHLKVYFRRASDYGLISDILTKKWKLDRRKLFFMNVDICRKDLLIEVEGCVNQKTS